MRRIATCRRQSFPPGWFLPLVDDAARVGEDAIGEEVEVPSIEAGLYA